MTPVSRLSPALMLGILVACGPPSNRSADDEARIIGDAGQVLSGSCLAHLPDIESVSIAFRRASGSRTGKTYRVLTEDGVFVGSELLDASGVGALVMESEAGTACAVTVFAVDPAHFEEGINADLAERDRIMPRFLRETRGGEREFALDGYALPGTLVYSTSSSTFGSDAMVAEIRVPDQLQTIDNRRARLRFNTRTLQDPVELPARSEATLQPPVPGSPPLTEGASYADFSADQITAYCRQDWRTRLTPKGRTEYNPCYERSAFR
ncbi:MAG: hypothetical protein AAF526_14075 [Pseudomonadota bacterium]